jgi:hypothetical protein
MEELNIPDTCITNEQKVFWLKELIANNKYANEEQRQQIQVLLATYSVGGRLLVDGQLPEHPDQIIPQEDATPRTSE